ncbi:MAG: M23 family metallopeptidase [Filifactoraceae bacterium]
MKFDFKLQSMPYFPMRITSHFGNRNRPNAAGATSDHDAVDIGRNKAKYPSEQGPCGPIYCVLDGVVTQNFFNSARGNRVVISSKVNGYTIEHGYQHLFARSPKAVGTQVKAGSIIGEMGKTGASTGTHLHFDMKINGKIIDPEPYLTGKVNPVEEYKQSKYSGSQKGTGKKTGSQNNESSNSDAGNDIDENQESKEITMVEVKSLQETASNQTVLDRLRPSKSMFELFIQNGNRVFKASVEGTVTITHNKNDAKTCTFSVIADGIIDFQEGNPIKVNVYGQNVFYGYIFEKERKSDVNIITVKAYDQLRYLKAKDSRLVESTASELLKSIANELRLKIGIVEETGYRTQPKVEEASYLEMILNSIDDTLLFAGKSFVLYDEENKLNLREIKNLLLPIVVDKNTARDFNYTSSIDSKTYNQIRIAIDDKESGTRKITVLNDPENQKLWGILPLYENASGVSNELATTRQKLLLTYYNQKTRKLKVSDQIGDSRVKAGNFVIVDLFLGDIIVKNYFIVESVTHKISNFEYTMDLTLVGARGGEFIA